MTAATTVQPRTELTDAIEEDLAKARDLNSLIHWISQAREQITALRSASDRDPRLSQLLKAIGIRSSGPEWSSDHEGMGLYRAHSQIGECLDRIAASAAEVQR
jgi:hypothetical protein